jgi:hypothetical protein
MLVRAIGIVPAELVRHAVEPARNGRPPPRLDPHQVHGKIVAPWSAPQKMS